MSTVETFRSMSGINQTSSLEITVERAQEIIQTVSSNHQEGTAVASVTLRPVSSYVSQVKPGMPGSATIVPNMPPFAAHWGIVVGVPQSRRRTAFLLHLVLKEDDQGQRSLQFRADSVDLESKSIQGDVKRVGETRFDLFELLHIGEEMISAFGNYHLVFWNCQMFAKCYLRVITGSDAAFDHWTTADVTNLFLCAFVVSTPIVSSLRFQQQRRMRQLHEAGTLAARAPKAEVDASADSKGERKNGDGIVTDEDLFRASDEAIDFMKEAIKDTETYKKLCDPVKDSSDKPGLIQSMKSLWEKVIG